MKLSDCTILLFSQSENNKDSRINKTGGFINCTILLYLSATHLNIIKILE